MLLNEWSGTTDRISNLKWTLQLLPNRWLTSHWSEQFTRLCSQESLGNRRFEHLHKQTVQMVWSFPVSFCRLYPYVSCFTFHILSLSVFLPFFLCTPMFHKLIMYLYVSLCWFICVSCTCFPVLVCPWFVPLGFLVCPQFLYFALVFSLDFPLPTFWVN